jgi:nucleosome assembly protein 1-like 1
MNNPALLGALQERLGSLVGQSSGYLETLPKSVHRRIAALENLQEKHSELQAQFRQEVLALEKKYHGLHGPIYEQRAKIVAGDYEPTDEEATSEEVNISILET